MSGRAAWGWLLRWITYIHWLGEWGRTTGVFWVLYTMICMGCIMTMHMDFHGAYIFVLYYMYVCVKNEPVMM